MPIYTEDIEVILGKKQPPPVTSTSTGQAVTPPTTSTPVVATGAFGPPPIVSKQPTVPATQPATFLMKGPTGQIDPTTQFWANLGTPQYIGRYAPFAIPTGYKVSGMVEQNGQLLVSFESTARGVSPSLMKNLEAFAVQANQDQPSTVQVSEVSPMLMTRKLQGPVEDAQNLFDPQAAVSEENTGYQKLHLGSAIPDGLPAPTFTLTTIATKQAAQIDQPFEQFPETGDPNDLVSWLNSQRTIGPNGNVIIPSESIQKPTLQEAYEQYRGVPLSELVKGASSIFYTSIGYPQYGGKYGTFNIPAGYRVLNISEQGSNLAVTFEAIPKESIQKPTLQEAYQQYHDVRMPELLKAESIQVYGGKAKGFVDQWVLPTYETTQTRTMPKAGMLGSFQTYEVKVVDTERLAEQTRLVENWNKEWATVESQARTQFELDLAKIGGSSDWMKQQRSNFDVYVQTQREQQYGQFVTQLIPYMKQWQPMGLAEKLANWTVTPKIVTSPQGMLFGTLPGKEVLVTPAAGIAGFIAPFERLTYVGLNLAGIGTPRPPSTVIGGIVSKGVGAVTGQPSNELERAIQNPMYAIGTVGGDIALGLIIGKVVSEAWSVLPSKITSPLEAISGRIKEATVGKVQGVATDYLSTQYQEAAEAGNVLAWKGFKESLVMQLTKTTPQLASGEVSIPVAETAQGIIPQGIPYTDLGWEMTEAPRMGGVMFTKIPTMGAEYVKFLPVMFGLGEELISFSQIQAEEKLGFSGGKEAPALRPGEAVQSVGGFDKGPSYSLEALKQNPSVMPTVKELMMREGYMPFTTQSMLTRMGIQPYITPSVGAGVVGGKASGSLILLALPTFTKPTLDVQPSTFTFKLEPPKLETSTRTIPSASPGFSTTTVLKPSEQKTDLLELSLPSGTNIVEPLTRQTLTLELAQKPSAKLSQTPDVFGDLAQPQLNKQTLTLEPIQKPSVKPLQTPELFGDMLQPQINQGLFQAPTLETKTKTQMIAPPIFQNLTDLTYSQDLDIPTLTTPSLTPKLAVTPMFDVPNVPPGTPVLTIPKPGYTPTPKNLFNLPKLSAGGLGPREPSSLLYPFGRQKRKYPVMTGGQAAKFLFSGTTQTKRRKKK